MPATSHTFSRMTINPKRAKNNSILCVINITKIIGIFWTVHTQLVLQNFANCSRACKKYTRNNQWTHTCINFCGMVYCQYAFHRTLMIMHSYTLKYFRICSLSRKILDGINCFMVDLNIMG